MVIYYFENIIWSGVHVYEDYNWVMSLVLVRNEFEKHQGILLIGGILFIILRLWFGRLGVRVKYFGERIRI